MDLTLPRPAAALALALTLGLAAPAAHAVGRPYLSVNGISGDPGFSFTYTGGGSAGNNHFSPEPGRVLRSSWEYDQNGAWYAGHARGFASAELGRLRAAEFASTRVVLDSMHAAAGIGGHLRYATFEDQLVFSGAALNPNTVVRINYHFAGTAGGRVETNVSDGGTGQVQIEAKLSMGIGGQGVEILERTWSDEVVTQGGQQRTSLASSGIFDLTATSFSMRLGERNPFFGNFEHNLRWALELHSACGVRLAALRPEMPSPSGGCTVSADYGGTASFDGLSLYDGTTGALIDPATYTLRSPSGFDYAVGFGSPVPEPQTWAMFALGLALVGWRQRGSRRDA